MLSAVSTYALPISKHDRLEKPKVKLATVASTWIEKQPRTVDELLRSRSETHPDQPIVSYPSSGVAYVDYTPRQINSFAFHAAQSYSKNIASRSSSAKTPSVVALLGPSDLDYLVTLLALSKIGHTVLFLSTRISHVAYKSLLEATGSNHLIFHPDFQGTAIALQKDLPNLQLNNIASRDVYDVGDVDLQVTKLDNALDFAIETGHIAWIIHSSGSTGLPKPIYQTHRAAINNYATNMKMRGFITLPLFHAHGVSSTLRAFYSMKQIHLYNAALPLTRQNLIDIMTAHDFEIFYGVPYALKLLAETTEGIQTLARLKVVMFGGSACPDSLGDKLVNQGVNLVSHYGTTETGQLMTSFRPPGDKAWDYVRPHDVVRPFLRFEERDPGLFELVCLDGWPSKVNSNRPDGSYATKDLFTKHATLEGYKYYARLDDTIVLVNGEKANPLSLEGKTREHELVAEAVVFGAGKASLGLILIPSELGSDLSKDALLDRIWPSLVVVQSDMPSYARVSRDMTVILPRETQYPRTDKGTVIRQAFYRQFADQIEGAYDETAKQGTLVLSESQLQDYIKTKAAEVLALKDSLALTVESDMFSLGMDSLQTNQLRGCIVRDINLKGQRLGLNVVFDYPTISKLASHIAGLGSVTQLPPRAIEEEMQDLINKYSSFEAHIPVEDSSSEGNSVIITGTTGSLGAHAAAQASTNPSIKFVYCLVRARDDIEAQDRLIQSLRTRNLYHSLPPSSRSKLIALRSDLSLPNLGLSESTLSGILSTLTCILHLAWSVNFNLHLSSFTPCILSSRNLISLCLRTRRSTPAKFAFCSSVSTVVNTPFGQPITEALPTSLSHAQGMGYAQSKLVTENICMNAVQSTGLTVKVLRVGQIIGDTRHGIWNATEAIPMMLQCSQTIGALPRLDEWARWLPVDVVATTILDIASPANVHDKSSGIFNVVNPLPFHWKRELLPMIRAMSLFDSGFEELERLDWLQRLRDSDPDPVINPPRKLFTFWEGKYGFEEEKRSSGDRKWETAATQRASAALGKVAAPLDQDLMAKILRRFLHDVWK